MYIHMHIYIQQHNHQTNTCNSRGIFRVVEKNLSYSKRFSIVQSSRTSIHTRKTSTTSFQPKKHRGSKKIELNVYKKNYIHAYILTGTSLHQTNRCAQSQDFLARFFFIEFRHARQPSHLQNSRCGCERGSVCVCVRAHVRCVNVTQDTAYICICICVYIVCIYTHMYKYTYMFIYIRVCISMYTHRNVKTRIFVYTYVYKYIFIYKCSYRNVYMNIYICMHV